MSDRGDVFRSILAGIGAGGVSLGESMSDREKAALALKRLKDQQEALDRRTPHFQVDYSDPQHPQLLRYNPETQELEPALIRGSRPLTGALTTELGMAPGSATRALSLLANGPRDELPDASVPDQGIPSAPPKRAAQAKPVAAPRTPELPMDMRMQKEIADLVANGMSVEKANERVRALHGQMPALPSYAITQTSDATGAGQTLAVNTKNPNQRVKIGSGPAKNISPATSAQTMMALGRMRQLSADLASAIPAMEAFESPDSTLNIGKVGLGMKAAGTAAMAHPNVETHGGLLEAVGNAGASALQGGAQKALAADPLGQRYRTYTTNQKRVGLGLAEILPRPNNALLGTEIALSGGDLGQFNPEQTKLIQERRRNAKKGIDALLAMNPAFVVSMQQQDPDFINNFIHTTIQTGKLPEVGTPASAKAPSGVDVNAIIKKYEVKKP